MEEGKYQKLLSDAKDYARVRYDLLRLELLEKLAKIVTLLAVGAISLVLALAAFVYCSFALVACMRPLFGSIVPPLLIVAGVFVLLLVVVWVCRDKLFLNPLIGKLSEILFSETNNDDSHDKPA